jgi:ATP-binding protein involved in chromosome partitioning
MGPLKFRTYHQVQGGDVSDLGGQVGRQRSRVAERLASVNRVVAVMSGKGGVGKSYVTAGIALAAAERSRRIGVLDADLAGPTTARMLGARGPVALEDGGVRPAVGINGLGVFSTDLLLEEGAPLRWKGENNEPFVWRGALEAGALREFLADVVWGELELLLIDLPPGTSRLQDLAELVPGLRGVIAVTIPTDESFQAVSRAMRAARDAGLPLLGVVENMAGYRCLDCGTTSPLFPGDAGDRLVSDFAVPLLARIPFVPSSGPPQPLTSLAEAILS